MKAIKFNQQKGFSILAVILVIVAVIVAIGVWALSGQSNVSSTGNGSLDIQASSVINDAMAIQSSYDRLIINGNTFGSIVFMPNIPSTATDPNMLDPMTGIQVPKVNSNIIRTGAAAPEGIWIYKMNFAVPPKVGSKRTLPAIMLGGIKDNVCNRINYNLYGITTSPSRPSGSSIQSFLNGATVQDPNALSSVQLIDEAITGIDGWTSGCLKSSLAVADNGIYFKILEIK